MASKTWLITGASSGFGKALAMAALEAGNKVIGTSRDISKAEKSSPKFKAQGGIWLEADPGSKDAQAFFTKVFEKHDVDVLVNNSGYAFIGAMEDTSEDEVRDQMEVNFYGPLRLVKACLPTMRRKRRGDIVLISSGAGFISRPSRSSYSASKYAIEAVHESLSHELESFNIKVLIVEPGAFRTPFSSSIRTPSQHQSTGGISEAYKGTPLEQMVATAHGMTSDLSFARGDPDKAASVMLKAVTEGHSNLRLPLGSDCVKALEIKIGQFQETLDAGRSIAISTDVDA